METQQINSAPADQAAILRDLVASGRFTDALTWRRGPEAGNRPEPEVELLSAMAAMRLGELDFSISLAATAHECFRFRGDQAGRMRSLNMLGAAAFEHGRMEEAERCFRETLELARSLDDTLMIARAANNLASVAHLRGDNEGAQALYRTALLHYQQTGDERGIIESYHNLCLAFRGRGLWDESESMGHEAVTRAEALAEPSLLGLTLMGLAELHLESGKIRLAERELDRAQQYATRGCDEIGLAEIGRIRARLAIMDDDLVTALREADAASQAARRLGCALVEGEAAAVGAQALRRLQRSEDALRRREEARVIFARMGASRALQVLEESWTEPAEIEGKTVGH
ncbi:MAG: tetratricopeptide repeat protein [Gemmatimonadota bacterium]